MNLNLKLFLTFAKVGAVTFGGGYAMLPILQREIVENNGWATEQDLTDYFAIGQCTPGVIAVNTATFVGYRVHGTCGSLCATLGVVSPSLVIITVIASVLKTFSSNVYVQHAFAGIRCAVCALVLGTIIKLFKSNLLGKARWVWGIFAIVLLAAEFTGLPTASLVVASALAGLLFSYLEARRAGHE